MYGLHSNTIEHCDRAVGTRIPRAAAHPQRCIPFTAGTPKISAWRTQESVASARISCGNTVITPPIHSIPPITNYILRAYIVITIFLSASHQLGRGERRLENVLRKLPLFQKAERWNGSAAKRSMDGAPCSLASLLLYQTKSPAKRWVPGMRSPGFRAVTAASSWPHVTSTLGKPDHPCSPATFFLSTLIY